MCVVAKNIQRVGIENGRAAFAFEAVKKVKEDKRIGKFENYRSYVKKMPSLIQVNGLGQALAFCYQKEKEYEAIYQALHEWFQEKYPHAFQGDKKEFVQVVINLPSAEYRLWTMEALALLNWMRKFVDGMAKENEEKEQ